MIKRKMAAVFLCGFLLACAGDAPPAGSDSSKPSDGGSTADGGSLPAVTDGESYCRAFAAARCQGIQSCCADPARKYPTQEACEQSMMAVCRYLILLDRPSCAVFDQAAAQAKIQQTLQASQSCLDQSTSLISVAYTVSNPGGSCTLLSNIYWNDCCSAGTYCLVSDPTSQSGACQPLLAEGQPCQTSHVCQGYCDQTAQLCRAKQPDGQPCELDEQCQTACSSSGLCGVDNDPDYFCTRSPSCVVQGPLEVYSQEGAEIGCTWRWTCAEGFSDVECLYGAGGLACTCKEDLVQGASFTGDASLCAYETPSEQVRAAVNSGCGWAIPE